MRLRLVAVTVAAVVGLAACGGSSSSSSTSTGNFVSLGNSACRLSNQQVKQLLAPSSDAGGIASYAGELLPIAKGLITKLSALTPPADAKAGYGEYLSILRSDASNLSQLRAAAQSANVDQITQLAGAINARGGSTVATKLGLTECAQDALPKDS